MAVFRVNDPRRVNSPWAASFTGADGKRKLRYCKTRKEADALLAQSAVAVSRGEYVDPSKSRTVTETAEAFLAAKRAQMQGGALRGSTVADYESLITLYIVPVLGHVKLRELSREHVEAFRAQLLDAPPEAVQGARAAAMAKRRGAEAVHRARLGPVGSRTVGKALTLLTMMLREAVQRGWCFRNVAEGVTLGCPRLESVDPARVLTTGEAVRLLERAEGMFRMMLLVALRTGIRQGEMLALTWGDVDLAAQRLHVRRSVRDGEVGDTKTRHSVRVVPLDSLLLRELKPWKLACPPTRERLLFPSTFGGGYVPASGLARRLRALIGRCGFERPELAGLRWHDLRHTFASHLLADGMDLVTVSRLLGHSSPTVTAKVYAHAIPDREAERREQLSQLYSTKNKHGQL